MKQKRPSEEVLRLHFNGHESDDERTVDVTLIDRAAYSGWRIDLRKAIITGPLQFNNHTFPSEVSLVDCILKSHVRFPCCVFSSNLILSGSAFLKGCNFRGATIAGELRLTRAQFSGSIVKFDDAQVDRVLWADRVQFRAGARFRRATFNKAAFFRRSTFEGKAIFEETQFCGEAAFTGAMFCQEAKFSSACISGQAGFSGVTFKNTVTFNGARIESHAFFCLGSGIKPAVTNFWGNADFSVLHIEGTADFRGAHFHNNTDFNSMRVGGDALFWSVPADDPVITIFEQGADFTGVHISGDVDFSGVIFAKAQLDSIFAAKICQEHQPLRATEIKKESKAEEEPRLISFNGATIVGHARFGSAKTKQELLVTTFALDADFTAIKIGGIALFKGVTFHRKADFNSARIAGDAFFSSLSEGKQVDTIFENDADFTGVQILGNAFFKGAQFLGKANFRGAYIHGVANFERNNFCGMTNFDYARFGQDVDFEQTVLRQHFSFRETSFRVIRFSPDGRVTKRPSANTIPNEEKEDQFQCSLNLSGCVYDRIQVDWKRLLKKSGRAGRPRIEYDLQPYDQLEKVFRSMGKNREADKIYLERCRTERHHKWDYGKGLRLGWASSGFYRIFANYGVRPIRIAAFSTILLIIGAFVFSQLGAVSPSKEEAKDSQQTSAQGSRKEIALTSSPRPIKLSFAGAAAVSLHQFLPIDIPSGSEWKPNRALIMRFIRSDVYGSILKISGWICVPLGVAAITGILRRAVR
jgi:uncharacterized protein YjbI with pentapeptide repeats